MHGPTCIVWANLTPSSLEPGRRPSFQQINATLDRAVLLAAGARHVKADVAAAVAAAPVPASRQLRPTQSNAVVSRSRTNTTT
jgi:hypothetical protein